MSNVSQRRSCSANVSRYQSDEEEEEDELEDGEEEEEGSSVEAEEEGHEHEAVASGEHEEVPEYSAGATAPIEVGPNGYAVSIHPKSDMCSNIRRLTRRSSLSSAPRLAFPTKPVTYLVVSRKPRLARRSPQPVRPFPPPPNLPMRMRVKAQRNRKPRRRSLLARSRTLLHL